MRTRHLRYRELNQKVHRARRDNNYVTDLSSVCCVVEELSTVPVAYLCKEDDGSKLLIISHQQRFARLTIEDLFGRPTTKESWR